MLVGVISRSLQISFPAVRLPVLSPSDLCILTEKFEQVVVNVANVYNVNHFNANSKKRW